MKSRLKCMIVVVLVAASTSSYVFAHSTNFVLRDTVVSDGAKQEIAFTFDTRLQGTSVTWRQISVKAVPQNILNAVAKKYPDYKVERAYEDLENKDKYRLFIGHMEKGDLIVIYGIDGKQKSEETVL